MWHNLYEQTDSFYKLLLIITHHLTVLKNSHSVSELVGEVEDGHEVGEDVAAAVGAAGHQDGVLGRGQVVPGDEARCTYFANTNLSGFLSLSMSVVLLFPLHRKFYFFCRQK